MSALIQAALPTACLAGYVLWLWPWLMKRLGLHWLRIPSVQTRTAYVVVLGVIWFLLELDLIPGLVASVAQGGAMVALLCAPRDDDDDHHKRKGRLRAAWKRAREYLARGIAAPLPESS